MTKIALITGGSRGLGRNAAVALAKRGVDVLITYHTRNDEAASLVAEIAELGRKGQALQLDTGKTASFGAFAVDVKKVLSENWGCGTFDFLVNNAGNEINKPFGETTEADFDLLMNVHFKGVYFLTQTLLPLISDGGRILNISSGLARYSVPGYSAYAAMKGAVETFTRYLAKELSPRRIGVNTIAPGAIETDLGGGAVRDNRQLNAFIASNTALGRVGIPDDIGPAIASFLSEDLRWTNGQRIEMAGGIHL